MREKLMSICFFHDDMSVCLLGMEICQWVYKNFAPIIMMFQNWIRDDFPKKGQSFLGCNIHVQCSDLFCASILY